MSDPTRLRPSRRTNRKRTAPAAPATTLVRREYDGGGLRTKLLDLSLRSTVKPFISVWAKAPGLPWPYGVADQAGRLLRPVPGTRYRRTRLPHCPATLVTSKESAASTRTIVYLHGGAFLVGGNHLHRQLISRVVQRTGTSVIAPEYRKLPRHPVAAAVTDAVDAYLWALDHGSQPEETVLMGDSAGGFLAVMVGVEIERRGLPTPAAIVAMSPLVDFIAPETPYPGCTLFPRSAINRFQDLAARVNRRAGLGPDPIESPVHAPHPGLPPTLVQVSSSECLYDDGCRLATALAEAGVHCELEVWANQVHVFQAAAGLLPEAAQALDNVADFVDRMVGAGRGRASGTAGAGVA